ncbi:MAG: hypothetical protein ABS52_11210 [Gemmatimonadetes bacterium SCN 70-22]|nr:MAG: hypothetical protein ABS52_11210 [Gemmatimonadetes bacterium SCN 70-22]
MIDDSLIRRLYLEMGARVRQRRETLKKTQDELAGDVGISRSSIANIERGQQHAPVHVLLGLAEALDVDMAALLPTHAELVALVDASRDVPKLVNIAGESSQLPPDVVQFLGTLLTQHHEPARAPAARPPARRRGRASPRSPRGTGEE